MAGLFIVLIFVLWGLFKLFSNLRRDGKARAERKRYEAKINSPKYKAEQEKRRKKELAYIKETLKKCRNNPDINLAIYNDEAREVHWHRLRTYGRSMYSGEMHYEGERGGTYTRRANGSKNYK